MYALGPKSIELAITPKTFLLLEYKYTYIKRIHLLNNRKKILKKLKLIFTLKNNCTIMQI